MAFNTKVQHQIFKIPSILHLPCSSISIISCPALSSGQLATLFLLLLDLAIRKSKFNS